MRLAYFHTDTMLSSWTNWAGPRILGAMGYEVLDAPIPTDRAGKVILAITPDEFAAYRARLPSIDALATCDVVIVMGIEYVRPWIEGLYPEWASLAPHRMGFFLESAGHRDVRLPLEALAQQYDVIAFASAWDTAKFGGISIRHGCVDLSQFCPGPLPKVYDAAFCGSLYPSRVSYLRKLQQHLDRPFLAGDVCAHGIEGDCHETWVGLYVDAIRQMRIHVALPSANPMPVSRPFETMACGTFLLESTVLPAPFEDGIHYRRYDPENLIQLAEFIEYYLGHDEIRETIAAAGCRVMHAQFSIEKFWREILA